MVMIVETDASYVTMFGLMCGVYRLGYWVGKNRKPTPE